VPAPARVVEATAEQLIATGALGYGPDPVDNDGGAWRPAGSAGRREVPWYTSEKARAFSVAAYRANPMARAVIDTYTAFCVGDSGLSYSVTNPDVERIVEEFWRDPRNQIGALQEAWLRDHLLMGESLTELMAGPASGRVRICPIATDRITEVALEAGNPLWPQQVKVRMGPGNDDRGLTVAAVDDASGLRQGEAQWWPSFKALLTDKRGQPFLSPILDWLDNYDTVLSNLIDRTALARYLVWDVTVSGDQDDVDAFVTRRGGLHVPPSGAVEVHNESVKWEAKSVQTGAVEDSMAAKSVLTLVAGGSGLAKTWLADPEDANRATSLTMAEPVRRRVGGVQAMWIANQTELVRYAVDRAVAAKRLPATVTATDPKTRQTYEIPASDTVTIKGPKIAAADADLTAKVLLNLSTGLEKMVKAGVLSKEGARVAARRAWEDYVGVPYTADLDSPDANPGDLATAVDDADTRNAAARASAPLRAVLNT
jgi:hypothetical protein